MPLSLKSLILDYHKITIIQKTTIKLKYKINSFFIFGLRVLDLVFTNRRRLLDHGDIPYRRNRGPLPCFKAHLALKSAL
jgi:hypothetical protein